jgi:hypothetical protein
MNELKQQHVDYLADQVRRLINSNSAEITEAFEDSADEETGKRKVKLSIAAQIKEAGAGRYEVKARVSFHKSTIRDEDFAIIDNKQLGLFDAVEKLRPKKGSGIDSVEFSAPGRDPVRLEAK